MTQVEDLTGFPECLDGRVKTLHPRVHAGILADRRLDTHVAQLADLGVEPFDLVVSNLYPFTQTVASGASPDECVEQIDIGGPSMVRAAAKNHPSVAIVTSPDRYADALEAVAAGGFTLDERQAAGRRGVRPHRGVRRGGGPVDGAGAGGRRHRLAGVRGPDAGARRRRCATARTPTSRPPSTSPRTCGGRSRRPSSCTARRCPTTTTSTPTPRSGQPTSRVDLPTVAIIKHANPCGIAVGADVADAHRRAHECDPVSAFGGVIAVNRPVSVAMAEQVAEVFTEVIVAPAYDEGAVEVLQGKKNIRILRTSGRGGVGLEFRQVCGGALVQVADTIEAEGDDPTSWTLATGEPASEEVLADLVFAWRACRSVKSNAILLASGGASVGIGMGQVNRVDSCKLAVERAGERAAGSVAASDAFFPFEDGPQILIDAGVTAIVQPGGSVRDELTVAACEAAGVTMYLTGTRHFAH